MKYLYLYLNIGSFIIPFLFSFYPKFQFYTKWKSLFSGIIVMMAFYISWDIIFTQNGFWGFNEAYITGYSLAGLPIEEWLFFICIPYACIFTHYALKHFFPDLSFSKRTTSIFYVALQSILIITLWYYYDRWYTLINFGYTILLLGFVYNYAPKKLAQFLPSFLIILLPFFFINGVLTGSGIEDQVVWYNDSENMGIRISTIPIEDSMYALGMILTVFVIMEWLLEKYPMQGSAKTP
ncbi:lycopene cyclase domain-containing protein [Patiriisocius sp. Uisw_017]|jgi:lycopene cyclase domain-containing protein|uniref:lycopene cyclase domain-containing protein n=1 Tax=Patiriisocius sp. Uisw_017 TaxID=3230968 RepID=UPI0039EA75C4